MVADYRGNAFQSNQLQVGWMVGWMAPDTGSPSGHNKCEINVLKAKEPKAMTFLALKLSS